MSKRIVHLTTVHQVEDPRIFHKEIPTLQAAGYEVHLVARHTEKTAHKGVPITPLTPVSGRYKRLTIFKEAYQKTVALKPDLVHFHDPELIPLAYWLKKRTGIRVLYDLHEDYLVRKKFPENRLIRMLENWAFTWLDHVILADEFYAPIVEGRRVPHHTVLNFFKPLGPPRSTPERMPEPVILLQTGVMSNLRGLSFLLEAGREIRKRGLPWKIRLVGIGYDARERAAFDAACEEAGLQEVIERIGWDRYVPQEAMLPHYEEASAALCLMEHSPAIPTKFYEYPSYGLPTICTDLPHWRAWMQAHEAGEPVPYLDADALIRVVQRWLDDPATYRRLAENGVQNTAPYRWASAEPHLLAAYRQVLGVPH